ALTAENRVRGLRALSCLSVHHCITNCKCWLGGHSRPAPFRVSGLRSAKSASYFVARYALSLLRYRRVAVFTCAIGRIDARDERISGQVPNHPSWRDRTGRHQGSIGGG